MVGKLIVYQTLVSSTGLLLKECYRNWPVFRYVTPINQPPVGSQVCTSPGTVFACSELYILVVFTKGCVIEKVNNWSSLILLPVSFLVLQRYTLFWAKTLPNEVAWGGAQTFTAWESSVKMCVNQGRLSCPDPETLETLSASCSWVSS